MLCYKTSFWFLGVCTWPWFEEDGLCVHGRALNWRFFGMMQQEHAEQFGVLSWQWWGVAASILSTMLSSVDSLIGKSRSFSGLYTQFSTMYLQEEKIFVISLNPKCSLCLFVATAGSRTSQWWRGPSSSGRTWRSMLRLSQPKKLPHPGTSSYDTIEAATKDPLIPAKLHFFMAVSRSMPPFLTKYQTDEPFIGNDLAELLKVRWIFSMHCEYDF